MMPYIGVMLGFVKKTPQHRAALARVRAWTRERFGLGEADTILVSEIACQLPGCPPLETVIAFWSPQGRHHFKVFKPVADVVADDLPPAWMKNALLASDDIDCDCC